MDDVKRFYEDGFIAEETFENAAVKSTLQTLEKLEYKALKLLGRGAFGSVFEVRSPNSRSNLAVKVVLEDRVSKSELETWSTLKHSNLLRLNESSHFPEACTYVFMTDVYPAALNRYLNNRYFLSDSRAFQRSTSWLKGILVGLDYLHSKNLCHLDLKTDNILITKEDVAVITDFGFVTSTSEFTSLYGSPLIYRPPECLTGNNWAKVDGSKYDMWTVGLLALEMFTKESLLKAAMNWKMQSVDYWPEEIHPTLFNILKQKQFRKLMEEAFPASNVFEEYAVNVNNVVKSLLSLNPEMRPSPKEALRHRLFGGNEFCDREEFAWTRQVGVPDMKALLRIFRILELNHRPRTSLHLDKDDSTETEQSSESEKSPIVVSEGSTGKSGAKTNIRYEKFSNDTEGGKVRDINVEQGNRKQKIVAWVRKKRSLLSTVFNRIRLKKK